MGWPEFVDGGPLNADDFAALFGPDLAYATHQAPQVLTAAEPAPSAITLDPATTVALAIRETPDVPRVNIPAITVSSTSDRPSPLAHQRQQSVIINPRYGSPVTIQTHRAQRYVSQAGVGVPLSVVAVIMFFALVDDLISLWFPWWSRYQA